MDAPLDTITSGEGAVTAETVTGTGTISYASVAELINQRVRLDGLRLAERDGKLWIQMPAMLAGKEFTLTGSADITVAEGGIQLKFSKLNAEGLPQLAIVQTMVNNYARQASVPIKLPAMPFQLVLQKVEPTPAGLAVSAVAKDVPLNG